MPVSTTYIESSSSNFYRSSPRPGDILLKKKYRTGGSAPRQNHHSDNKGTNRHKNPNPTSYAPVRVKVLDMRRGMRTVMMTQEQFAALDWGWTIE